MVIALAAVKNVQCVRESEKDLQDLARLSDLPLPYQDPDPDPLLEPEGPNAGDTFSSRHKDSNTKTSEELLRIILIIEVNLIEKQAWTWLLSDDIADEHAHDTIHGNWHPNRDKHCIKPECTVAGGNFVVLLSANRKKRERHLTRAEESVPQR